MRSGVRRNPCRRKALVAPRHLQRRAGLSVSRVDDRVCCKATVVWGPETLQL